MSKTTGFDQRGYSFRRLRPQALRVLRLLAKGHKLSQARVDRWMNPIANLRSSITELRNAGIGITSVAKESRPGVRYVMQAH